MPHKLIISFDEELGRNFEVEHLSNCPSTMQHGYPEWSCGEGWVLDMIGLPKELMGLPDGEYEIKFWEETRKNYTGALEHDYGIELVES